MSFEFNWSILDNEQLRNNILNKLNQLIQDKLPKLPNNNSNDNDNNSKVDITTFNLLLTTLDPKILSIHFGNTKPELKLIHLDVNSNNLQSGSITFEINYNNDNKYNNINDDQAHITIQINAQGNPISAKTYLEYIRNSYMGILDSDRPAFIQLRLKLIHLNIQGKITIHTRMKQSPLQLLTNPNNNENNINNDNINDNDDVAGFVEVVFHNNPLKSFDFESNLDGSTAALTLRSTIQEKLSEAIIKMLSEPLIIPIPKSLIPTKLPS